MKFHKVIAFGFVENICEIYIHTIDKLCNPSVLYLYMGDGDILLVTNDKQFLI